MLKHFITVVSRLAAAGAAILIASTWMSAQVQAQQWPTQTIHMVNGFPPGSGADVITRFVAEKLGVALNQPVVVENRMGAAGNISVEYVAQSKPDGYTLLFGTGSAIASLMHLLKDPPVDVTKSFKVAATISRQAFMMVVDAKSPYTSVAQLTDAMKKKGAAANYATSAPTGIVMGELYKAMTGVEATEVRYRSSADALNEIFAGKVDYGMFDPQMALSQAQQGKLRILAHSAGQRLKAVSDIPTMAESGVSGMSGMDLTGWWAILAPAETPRPILERLNAVVNQFLQSEEARDFFARMGGNDPFINTLDRSQALFLEEEKKWKEYVRISKIEPQ